RARRLQLLPESSLPEVPGSHRAAMARRPRGGAPAGSLLSRRLHPTGRNRRRRVPEQGGRLRPPVQNRRGGADHHRRRPEASRRAHRPDRRTAHLGLGADPPSARPRHRSRRRPVAGRFSLDRLPARLLPAVRVLSRLFRRLFLEGLAALHAAGRLAFLGDLARLADKAAFDAVLAPLRRSEWVVYAKRPFAGPKAVLAYLSRYTHRVAISNSRLIRLDDDGVTFRWKDYRARGKAPGEAWIKPMTLAADEFIRRFLLHVLPSGFHRIRHYGFLASPGRAATIGRLRDLIAASDATARPRPETDA